MGETIGTGVDLSKVVGLITSHYHILCPAPRTFRSGECDNQLDRAELVPKNPECGTGKSISVYPI